MQPALGYNTDQAYFALGVAVATGLSSGFFASGEAPVFGVPVGEPVGEGEAAGVGDKVGAGVGVAFGGSGFGSQALKTAAETAKTVERMIVIDLLILFLL